MNNNWDDVKRFHQKFNQPVAEYPVMLNEDRTAKRYQWMKEEIEEFKESSDIYEQADAMIDLIYFALGTLVEMGIEPQGLFDVVHNANMQKLWPDGNAHYGPDGKVIKSPAWVDPAERIKAIIDTSLNNK